MRISSLLVLLALLVGCATTPRIKVTRYTEATYAPASSVDVLHTKPSEKPYDEIAQISIQLRPIDEEMAIVHLKEKAKTLGADAIIVLGENTRGAVAVPMGTTAVAVPIRFLNIVAIRYRR